MQEATPQKPAPPDRQLWTRQDVAEFLRVSLDVVDRLDLPRLHINARTVRFFPSEVREWAAVRLSYRLTA
ncbi:MAG TPA: hypothetical protein VFK13_07060 [Gemmatimonadaceae bacterium]|nr:hypothetical protein [Gemmatimonadaceae bacterium]